MEGLPRRIKTRLLFKNFNNKELVDITKKKLLEKKVRFPHEVDDILLNCYSKVPAKVVAISNAALCSDLIDSIQTRQERRLPLNCSEADLNKFMIDDVVSGCEDFLNTQGKEDKRTATARDTGTMTDIIEFYFNLL